jgi:hypothetical protein
VAHKYEGDRSNIDKLGIILRKLQKEHPEHSYFSPLHNFSYLEYDDMAYNDMMECCKDWLNESDMLLIVGDLSKGVEEELRLAEACCMEVEWLEDTE